MQGGTRRTAMKLGAGASLLALIATGCSKDSKPESARKCAVVQADELSKLADAKLTLLKAEKGSRICRFVSSDGGVEVQTSVDGPVEKGLAELLLTDPDKMAKVGDEGWISTKDTPLGTRALVRKAGALLTIDLSAPKLSGKARKALARDIAEAGVPNLPALKVKKASGERGADACERYESDEISVAMGGVPTVEPTTPPGSCRLSVQAIDLTANVGILLESGAGKEQLDAIVGAVETAEPTKVGDAPAYWIPSPAGADTGGQLDLVAGDRLLQVAIIGQGLAEGEALDMAMVIAKTASADG